MVTVVVKYMYVQTYVAVCTYRLVMPQDNDLLPMNIFCRHGNGCSGLNMCAKFHCLMY